MRSIGLPALAFLVSACGSGPRLDTRTFEIAHLDMERAEALLAPYIFVDREKAPGTMRVAGPVITVRETPDNLEKIARVLAQYDRPRPPIRLRFQVIHADGAATSDPAIANVEGALRSLFRFKGYRLAAEAVVGGLEGSHVAQSVTGDGAAYYIQAYIAELRGSGDSTMVRLRVEFSIIGADAARLETGVSVRAGQTVVLGNLGAPTRKGTVILTVTPELTGA